MSYPVLKGDPTSYNEAVASRSVGTKYRHFDSTYGWRTLMYVKLADAVAVAAGTVVTWSDSGYGQVTADWSAGCKIGAGVGIGTITATYYGFIVCGYGDWALMNTDGGVAAVATPLVPHSVDGELDDMADTEEHLVCAVATAADSSTTAPQVVGIWLGR